MAGNDITFWPLCHQFPHMNFTKHDEASGHECSTTPLNMSLMDHVMTVTVLISFSKLHYSVFEIYTPFFKFKLNQLMHKNY